MSRSAGEVRRGEAALAVVLVCGILAGCDSAPQKSKKPSPIVLAEVNGEPVSRADLLANLITQGKPEVPKTDREKVLRTLVEQLVERRLMLQRFRDSGEYVDESQVKRFVESIRRQYGSRKMESVLRDEGIDPKRWFRSIRETLEIEQLLKREVYSKVKVSEKEIRAVYEKNPERYRLKRRWRVRQIVVPTKEEAKKLRDQALGGASFPALARKHSVGPERNLGGDMGFFSEGELPESIETVIKYLKEREISRVVKSPAGYHLLQVSERRSAGLQPLESVRGEIKARLLAEKGRVRLAAWLAALRKKAVIRYFWRNLEHVSTG